MKSLFADEATTERIERSLQRRWDRWLLALALWTFVALFFTSETYLSYKYSNGQAHTSIILKLNLGNWYLWGLLAPGIIWLTRKVPIEKSRWAQSAFLHSVVGIGIALLKWWLDNLFRQHVLGLPGSMSLIFVFQQNLLTYWVIVAASQGYVYYLRYREGEVRSAHLATELAQAQLQTLRMQLQPHFLFNTLNSIAALTHTQPDVADRMIARLSDLLRMTLENINVQEVSLAEELDFLEHYLEIERTRFSDRLQVHMEIAPETLRASTPYLILQPLVENAIRHGISFRSTPGCVIVSANRDAQMLVLAVSDDGPGIQPQAPSRNGIGLSSTQTRLETLYGAAHRFELHNVSGGGLTVLMAFPFRVARNRTVACSKEAVL